MADELLSVELQGFDEVAKKFAGSKSVIDGAQKKMLELATMIAWGKAKELTPVDKSTLRGSLERKVDSQGGKVFTSMKYAGFQEFGTGIYSIHPSAPHAPITPRRAKFLAWKGKDGIWHRAKSVLGVKPRQFMAGGLKEVQARAKQIINEGKAFIGYNLFKVK